MERRTFSEAVRTVVDGSDYTYADLARNLGVSTANVAQMLRQKSVSVDRAARVAGVLHYDVVLVPKGKRLPAGAIVLGEAGER